MCLIFYFLLKAVKYPTYLYKPVNIQTNKLKSFIPLLFLIFFYKDVYGTKPRKAVRLVWAKHIELTYSKGFRNR